MRKNVFMIHNILWKPFAVEIVYYLYNISDIINNISDISILWDFVSVTCCDEIYEWMNVERKLDCFGLFHKFRVYKMAALISTRVCESPGCNTTAKLQCPTCVKLGIQGSYFCSQVGVDNNIPFPKYI